MHFEKTIKQNVVYEGKFVRLRCDDVELENGRMVKRELLEHPGAVAIAAFDAEDRILMVRQYRYGVAQTMLELPAGKIDAGEVPEICAARELREETGYTAKNFKYLTKTYPTPAYCSEVLYLYEATDLAQETQCLDEDEFLSVEKYPFAEVVEMVLRGEITDSKTQTTVLLLSELRRRG